MTRQTNIFFAAWLLLVFVQSWSAMVIAQESPAQLSGFEPSEIFDIKDGGPVEIGNDVLLRLLLRGFQVSDKSLRRAAQATVAVSLQDVHDNPRDYRFYSFEIAGIANEFKSYRSERDELLIDGFHLLHVTDDAGDECLVALPMVSDKRQLDSIPASWTAGESLDQPVRLIGFFMGLRSFDDDDGSTVSAPAALQNRLNPPLFVARKVQWYPNRRSEKFDVDDMDVLLAAQGVDFHQLGQVGKNRNSGIGVDEALSFYQLLKAATRIESMQFKNSRIDLETMLRNPRQCLAEPVRLTGHLRRVTEIPIEDDEIRQLLEMDRYFQIDMFVPLDNRRIVIKPPGIKANEKNDAEVGSSSNLVIENRFPVTVCTASLPMAQGDINRNRISVQGFFFKNWSYESELSIDSQSGVQQIAPLIIAREPDIAPLGPDYFSWLLTAFGIAVLLGVLGLAWFMRPGRSAGPRHPVPEQIELPDVDS